MKRKLTYSCPLPLYVAYYVLMVLSISLVVFSFQLNLEGFLFVQILATGIMTGIISSLLILHSTEIIKGIDSLEWKKDAAKYYNDEGDFKYTYNGFIIKTWKSGNLELRWKDVVKIESRERKMNDFLKVVCIDIYFSEKEFITVDSSINGFQLFEKRLRENLETIWTRNIPAAVEEEKEVPAKKTINLS